MLRIVSSRCHSSSGKVSWPERICASEGGGGGGDPCHHGKMKQHYQRPVSLFTVAVQTMGCSHCRIDPQSFQLVFCFYSNGFWEKNKQGGRGRDQSGSLSHCARLHAVRLLRRVFPPTQGVFSCSRFSFSSKWRCTC